MARDTTYQLFKTGRTDPTLTHIWAFASESERTNWLLSRPMLTLSANKYWRVGDTIKINVNYETALNYDYIRITNDSTDANKRRDWYAFITARAYVSPTVTLLTLDVDYVQTYYFSGTAPFWAVPGFLVRSTDMDELPPVGTVSEYPVQQSQCHAFSALDTGNYGFVVYSTVDLRQTSSETHTLSMINGLFMVATPYLMASDNPQTLLQNLGTLLRHFNDMGITDAISGIYAIPIALIPSNIRDGNIHLGSDANVLQTVMYQIAQPTNIDGVSTYETLPILTDYDYSTIIVNNGQGETVTFHFNEFTGTPTFQISCSLSGGSPTLYCTPTNLAFNSLDAIRQRSLKITQAPSCAWLNDTYKIWLAQTQSSRQAAIDDAEIQIRHAVEAREKSFAYNLGATGILQTETEVGERVAEASQRGIISSFDAMARPIKSAAAAAASAITGRQIDIDSEENQLTNILGVQDTGATPWLNQLYNLGVTYLNHQLGIERTYQYDHAVANANSALNQLMAGYQDKSRIPPTARGSNAYGDMVALRQYGFMFGTYTPNGESAYLLDTLLRSSGHVVNQHITYPIRKAHELFDYVMLNSAKIAVNISNRPEFVRKMMIDLLGRGVYLWYISGGDFSEYYGSPYGIDNPEVDGNG